MLMAMLHDFILLWCHLRHHETARFRKCKQLFEYLLRDLETETSGGQSSNIYLNVVHFFQNQS
jgi:hypothetical protein